MSLGKRLRRFVRQVLRPDDSGRRSVEHEGIKLGRDVSDAFGPAEGGVDGGGGAGYRYFEDRTQRKVRR